MNSGCAVVASHAIGSVPYLMKNGENGMIYESGNVEMLYEKVKYLLAHPDMQRKLGEAAYKTLLTQWNATIAAERFLILEDALLKGEKQPSLYETGLCSKAELVYDNWMKES
jgi:glycosyltransferase involved in cell wall biosynthesis